MKKAPLFKNYRKDNQNKVSAVWQKFSDKVITVLMLDPLMPVQLEPEVPHEQTRVEKKFFVAFAWTVNILVILICAFFLILYGFKMGPKKSLKWASVVLLNLGKAIFLTQPIKMAILSFLLAFVVKTPNRDKLTFSIEPEGVDRHLRNDTDFMSNLMSLRSKPMYYPLKQHEVLVAKQARKMREKNEWNNITFIYVCAVYILLIIIIVTLESHSSYQHTKHIVDMLQLHDDDNGYRQFISKSSLLSYMSGTLFPSLHNKESLPNNRAEEHFDGANHTKGWTKDYVNKLFGIPRLRQIRVRNGTCDVVGQFKKWFGSCNGSLSVGNQDDQSYSEGWKKKIPLTWNYSSPETSESMDLYGSTGSRYPGGGYLQTLSHEPWDSEQIVTRLNLTDWFDGRMRAVMIEFNLYNIHSSFFAFVTIIVECLASGVYTTRVYVDSGYHEFFLKDLDLTFLTVLIFLLVIMILSVVRIIIHMSMKGIKDYFSESGHIIDVLIVFFGFSSIISAALRASYFQVYSRRFGEQFVSFAYPFYHDDLLTVILCIFVSLTAMRLLMLLHYGEKFFIARRALSESFYYTFAILLLTCIVTSLITVLMYSCRMQHTVLFPNLPMTKREKSPYDSVAYSTAINFNYLMCTLYVCSVFVFYYGRAKHYLEVYGQGYKCINRFLYMYGKLFKDILHQQAGAEGKKASIRLRGRRVLSDERLLLKQEIDWSHIKNPIRTLYSDLKYDWLERRLISESISELLVQMDGTILRQEKMCAQLETLVDLLDT